MSDNTPVKTILILAANPVNTSRLRLDEEVREIDTGLQRAKKRDQFKLEQKWAVRARDFYRAILDVQPQIVHFCGHGVEQDGDGIVLEDETGQVALVQADALASMFKLFARKGVECVVLNACYSELQAQAVSQYVNYVIGMNKAVGDKAAVAFAVAFYDAIGAGEEVEFAYELGCSQMIGFLEEQTPVLKKKELIESVSIPFKTEIIPPNPYQGLSAFEEKDAVFFFGREKFVDALVQATHKQPLVAVVGPSGSGKSSVVFAGLVPQLRGEGDWLIESFRPGTEPFYQLAFALVRQLEPELGETGQLREAAGLATDVQQGKVTLPQIVSRITQRNQGKRMLLVADQLEELYTLCQVKEEQERFADILLDVIAHNCLTLVFTLRADFYGYVLSYRSWRDALEQFTPKLLSSMSREELQRAIEQPAHKLEVELEAQLTQRILDDVGNEPGNLPLLEFALTRLWSLQQNRVLTHRAYDEIGGVKKALANHAEQVYQQLSEIQRLATQRIFVQLVRPGEGTEDTRRVATRNEVGEQNWQLVSYLAGYQARLVVTGRDEKSQEDTVEVVHEALIRTWSNLREWMSANRQFRVWQERLKVVIQEWISSNHDPEALLRGGSLTVAQEWLHLRSDEMTNQERDFIGVSTQQRNRERQEVERRRQRTKNILIGGFVGALSLAGLASWQWQRAEQNISMVANLLVEQPKALFDKGSQLETLIASVKVLKKLKEIESDDKSHLNTLQKLISEIQELNRFPSKENVTQLSFSPYGNIIASVHSDGSLILCPTHPIQFKKEICIDRYKNLRHKITTLSFSPTENIIVAGSEDGLIFILNPNDGREISQKVSSEGIWKIKFNSKGDIFASLSNDGKIRIWKIKDKNFKLIDKISSNSTESNYTLSFSPTENIFAVANYGTIEIWQEKTEKSKLLAKKKGSDKNINDISFSPDGSTIAFGGADGIVKLWQKRGKDWNHYKEETLQNGPNLSVPSTVNSVSFIHDGNIITSGSIDGILRLWKKDGSFLNEFNCGSPINDVAFNPQGNIVGCATDNDLRLWNVRKLTPIKNSTTDLSTLLQSSCNYLGSYFIVNPEILNKNRDLCPNIYK